MEAWIFKKQAKQNEMTVMSTQCWQGGSVEAPKLKMLRIALLQRSEEVKEEKESKMSQKTHVILF